MDKMDKSSLESAIINEAEDKIRVIALKEAEEVKKIRDEYAAEIEDFSSSMESRTNAGIGHESSKAESRAGLDLKKLKLRSVEAFISRAVEEVAKGIRENHGYKSFLLDAVRDAVSRIPAGVEIRLNREDLIHELEIRAAVTGSGARDISVVEDKSIKWGGCIVVDANGGRIFDGTIERIFFRKSSAIRREVMEILGNHPGNAA